MFCLDYKKGRTILNLIYLRRARGEAERQHNNLNSVALDMLDKDLAVIRKSDMGKKPNLDSKKAY